MTSGDHQRSTTWSRYDSASVARCFQAGGDVCTCTSICNVIEMQYTFKKLAIPHASCKSMRMFLGMRYLGLPFWHARAWFPWYVIVASRDSAWSHSIGSALRLKVFPHFAVRANGENCHSHQKTKHFFCTWWPLVSGPQSQREFFVKICESSDYLVSIFSMF